MITGLRSRGNSLQNFFLILNLIFQYLEKAVGGGLPIGLIAISKEIEKHLLKKKNKVFFWWNVFGKFNGILCRNVCI